MQTPSFFDYAMQDQGGTRSRKFLSEMKAFIPWEELEEMLIKEGAYRPKQPGKAGRPPYKASVLLGSLFLQAWYSLSDPMTEELIHDRLSFREFLEIQADDDIPDETTIGNFRNALMDRMLFDKIFAIVLSHMKAHDLVLKEGTLVDATLIHSPKPKRKKDSSGTVMSNKANDADATYTSKRNQKYHGYKIHIGTDPNGIIKKMTTTTAKDSDTKEFEYLTQDEEHFVSADSAYMSKDRKKGLRKKRIVNGIIERRVRGQSKLRPKQQKHNKRFAPIRGLAELSFAFLKYHMGYRVTRFIGLEKNDQYHLLLGAACNLRRAPALIQKLHPQRGQ